MGVVTGNMRDLLLTRSFICTESTVLVRSGYSFVAVEVKV